jgi:hypothetical protein
MTSSPYPPDYDVLGQIKKSAEHSEPAPIDLSFRIMFRIQNEASVGANKRKRLSLAIVSVLISIGLLSGFTYAATQTDWFVIKDDSGRELMQVKAYQEDPALSETTKRVDRILAAVREKLLPGETAQVLIGQEDIDAYMTHGYANGGMFVASQSLTYKSTKEVSAYLSGYMSRLKLPADDVGEAKLTLAEVLPNTETRYSLPSDQWVNAIDAESGTSYAYFKNPNGERRFASEQDSLRLTYADNDATYQLGITYGAFDVTLYDIDPSTARIHEVAGVQIYERNDANDYGPRLTWSVPLDRGNIVFLLNSPQSDTKKLLSFAKAVIEATAIGGE